jgi:hypothetical protein
MASYTITWSCGHTSDKQLYGPTSERDSYVEWASLHGICPACYAIEKDRQHKAKIEQDKLVAQEAAGRLQDNGIIMLALTGTEKQIAWAKDIRAKLMDGPVGWAVKIVMDRNPELVLKAKYWIDKRDREPIDWARLALPKTWNQEWAPGCPEVKAAVTILKGRKNVHYLGDTMEQTILHIANLTALPVEEERPTLGDYGNRDAIDNWLVCQWARNGLIDWLKARMQASVDTAADARAVAQRATEANEQKREAECQIEEARKITELAKSFLEQAEKIAGIASLIVGAPGLIDGQEFILTDVRDEGASVLVRESKGEEILDLSAHAWCQAHMRYLGRLADSQVHI